MIIIVIFKLVILILKMKTTIIIIIVSNKEVMIKFITRKVLLIMKFMVKDRPDSRKET